MNRNFPEENMLRQYLLGRLDDQEAMESALSEQILMDDQLSEMVDALEDQIIEDYLDETLNPADREAFRKCFLRPSERREKLKLARLLRGHFGAQPDDSRENKREYQPGIVPGPVVSVPGNGLIVYWRSHIRIFSEIASLIVLTFCFFFYISRLQQANQKTQEKLENDLTLERMHTAQLAARLQPELPLILNKRSRSIDRDKTLIIGRLAQRVSVEIKGNFENVYDAHLSSSSGETWFQSNLRGHPNGLFFDLPAAAIADGDNCIRLTSRQGEEEYCFQVKRVQ